MARQRAAPNAVSLLVLGAVIAVNALSATPGSAVSQPLIAGW